MIDRDELASVARTKGITNKGYSEKDYLQEILMLAVSREVPELVFKGGTALYKLHGLDRFSEDLDFSGSISDAEVGRLAGYLDAFGFRTETTIDRPRSGTLLTFVSEGFIYRGDPRSLSRIRMDVNADDPLLEPEWKQFFPKYPDIPSFRLRALALDEMLAEKTRALLVRRKARDAYDVWYLLEKGVRTDPALLQKKLDAYNMKLDNGLLMDSLNECGNIWQTELRPLMIRFPEFEVVRKRIVEGLGL